MLTQAVRSTLWALGALLLFTAPVRAQGDAPATFKAKCAACHGDDGKGATPAGQKLGAHDFTSPDAAKMTDAELIEIIKQGKNKMPAYGDKLSDQEIKDLVAYIRKFAKK
jgi:mono/diheme cytochrome c family protein